MGAHLSCDLSPRHSAHKPPSKGQGLVAQHAKLHQIVHLFLYNLCPFQSSLHTSCWKTHSVPNTMVSHRLCQWLASIWVKHSNDFLSPYASSLCPDSPQLLKNCQNSPVFYYFGIPDDIVSDRGPLVYFTRLVEHYTEAKGLYQPNFQIP